MAIRTDDPATRYVYAWRIVMRNERMGFVRTFDAEGVTYNDAVDDARRQLAERYVDTTEFIPVAIERRNIVRSTVAS